MEYTAGETNFRPICGSCGEPIETVTTGKGKRKQRHEVCACNPAPVPETATKARRCAPGSTKRKGRVGEKRTEQEWGAWGFDAQSTVGSGAAASRSSESAFDTDVVIRHGDTFRAKIESKKHAKLPIASLVKMLDRSDFLRLEEDRQPAFYFVKAEKLGELAKWAAEGMRRARGA